MTPSSKAQASSSMSMSMPARRRQGDLEQEGGLVDIRMPLLVCLVYIPCVFLLLLLILIAALQLQSTVGLKDEDETTTKDPRMGQTIGGGREHNDLYDGDKSAAVDDDKVLPLQVDEDSLDFRQSLRTFEDTKDTSPSNSTYAPPLQIHEIELGSIQPLTQQHASHDAHQSSPVTDERTSDVTGHLSPSDHIVTIHGDELDAIQPLTQRQTSPDAYQRTSDVPDHVSPSDNIIMIRDNELDAVQRLTQWQTSLDAYPRTPDVTDHASPSDHIVMINGIELGATQPQTQLQTSPDIHRSTLDERMSTNGTDQMVPSNSTLLTNINNRQQQNPLHGFLSRVAPSTDDRIFDDEPNYIALLFYAPVIIVALPFLLGLLHLILLIG
eukprot:TRINITY_DN22729_c0_g1_i1.p1 TRINITY_DN22729_c0_g1~~TRINITY_DN22729_c0_g1_i1.p1  ORF type:complete len:382 (-),score=64.33 TRINITY_DN22729_c0_g1_i1:382-1527(-)